MNGIFRWSMRHGAKFLFALALIQLLIGVVPFIAALFTETGHMARNLGYSPDPSGFPFAIQLQLLLHAISSAAFPFFGALLIDRLDRWLAARDGKAGQ
jgi:hypothetical protein